MKALALNLRLLRPVGPNLSLSFQKRPLFRTTSVCFVYKQAPQVKLLLAENLGSRVTQCTCLEKFSVSPNYNVLHPSSVRLYATKTEDEPPEPKLSLYQRFKAMYRDYWYVLLPVHLVTSAAWFGGFYYMASSGVDIVSILEKLNISEKLISPFRNGHATTGYLAISYALYKIATPLRYTVTLGGTTISINYLRQWGYIKPVPSKEKLKELYEGKKEIIKEKGQTLKDNMIQSLKPTANDKGVQSTQ